MANLPKPPTDAFIDSGKTKKLSSPFIEWFNSLFNKTKELEKEIEDLEQIIYGLEQRIYDLENP